LKPDIKAPKPLQSRLLAFKTKAAAVLNQLDIPMSIYAATEKDIYRKPRVGMWKEMLEDFDIAPNVVDLDNSFFVGDAGGRIAEHGKAKDFSCSDRYTTLCRTYLEVKLLILSGISRGTSELDSLPLKSISCRKIPENIDALLTLINILLMRLRKQTVRSHPIQAASPLLIRMQSLSYFRNGTIKTW
jgi:hypothetical protein